MCVCVLQNDSEELKRKEASKRPESQSWETDGHNSVYADAISSN